MEEIEVITKEAKLKLLNLEKDNSPAIGVNITLFPVSDETKR